MKYCILTVTLCAVTGLCLAQTATPASKPASRPTSQPTTKPDSAIVIARCIKDIRDAARPEQAGTAYAKGCQANRQDPALHNAYMLRLIQFKQLPLADYPARTLTTLEPENALAWAVSGYNAAKKGDLDRAMKCLTHAAAINPQDKATAANLGQMIAWYDSLPKPPFRLSAAEAATLKEARNNLANDPDFEDSAGRVNKAVEAYKDKLAETATNLEKAKSELSEIQSAGKAQETDYNNIQDRLKDIRLTINRKQGIADDKNSDAIVVAQMRSDISELQSEQSRVKRESDDLKAQVQKTKAQFDRKNREINDLKKRSAQPVEYSKLFQWQPPTAASLTKQPTSTTASAPAVEDPQ